MILNLKINIFCKMFCLKFVFVITVFKNKWKWKWRDIRPSMVTHTQNLCSTFNPSKVHAHSSEHTHTHTPWTHTRRSGQPFMLWSPGSSWGCRALLKGTSVVVLRVERSVYIHPPNRQSMPDQDSDSQPFDYESDSLTSRPQLPCFLVWYFVI